MNRPLRILHVASHLDIRMGGSIVAAAQIAETVAGEEFSCTVAGTVVAGSGTEGYFRANYPRVQFEPFPMAFPRHSFNSPRLRRWLKSAAGQFDVVHTHGLFNFPYLFGGRAALAAGVPLVISPHNSLDPYDLRKKAWLKRLVYGPWMVRPLLAGCARVLCCAPLEARRLVTYGAHPNPEVATVPLPVAPLPASAPAGEWRRRHGFAADACVLLFLSRLDRKKGLDLLVPAFLSVAREDPSAMLAIAGDGDEALATELRRLVAQSGLEDRVRWLGFVTGEERVQALRGCDVFVLPSYNENFGIAVVEALHAGRPVLISNEVYIHEVLSRRGCAEVCEPTGAGVLAALRRLVSDRAHRERLARQAEATALAEFAPDVVRDQLRELYRQVRRENCRDRIAPPGA